MMNLGQANPEVFAHGVAGVLDPALKAAPAPARP